MTIPTVSPRFMHAAFEYLATAGFDESVVLGALQCERKQQLVLNGRVLLRDYERLFNVGEALTGDAHFGLNMGASPLPRTWGLVSHLVLSAPTAVLALTALMNYSRLQLDFAQFSMSEPEGEEVVISWHSETHRPPSRHVIEHVFANIIQLANFQAGYQTSRGRIEFKHDAAGDAQRVETALNCDVTFGCQHDRIFVGKQFFQQQSRYGQEDLFPFTEDLARQRLMKLRGEDPLTNAIRETILKQLPFGLPKVADTAGRLNMTSRTLQRRLQERNIKYQTLLDEVRRELSRQLIVKPELSLSEIADYLGFSDQSAFQHAFARWENTTPGRFRSGL